MTCFQVSLKLLSYSNTWHLCSPITVTVYTITITVIGEQQCWVLNLMKFWEKLESKSSYHFPNSWWFRGQIVLNTWHLRKLWRAHEDQIKPRTSELFESETLEQFTIYTFTIYTCENDKYDGRDKKLYKNTMCKLHACKCKCSQVVGRYIYLLSTGWPVCLVPK